MASTILGLAPTQFRVVGIHRDVGIDREISIVCSQIPNDAGSIDQTPFEARI